MSFSPSDDVSDSSEPFRSPASTVELYAVNIDAVLSTEYRRRASACERDEAIEARSPAAHQPGSISPLRRQPSVSAALKRVSQTYPYPNP